MLIFFFNGPFIAAQYNVTKEADSELNIFSFLLEQKCI